MRKWLVAALSVVSLSLSVPAQADSVVTLSYLPYNGLWLFYQSDAPSYFLDADFWVYCGYGCTEYSASAVYTPTEGWFHDPVNHNYFADRPEWYVQIEYGSEYGGWESTFSGTFHAAWDCSDIRSYINQEYVDGGQYGSSAYMPLCGIGGSGFTQGPGWGPFPFSALNDGYYQWAVIRNNYLYDFTANIQYNVGYGIRVTSGYRNPTRNNSVGGAPLSRHVFGDGVDVKPASAPAGCIGAATWAQLHDAAVNSGGTWFENYNDDCTHLHVDLRNW